MCGCLPLRYTWIYVIGVILIPVFKISAQSIPQSKGHFYVAFYNVENLFDTLYNPVGDDITFLPGGQHHWGSTSYKQKVHNIASVLASMNDSAGPDLAGLAEVENRHVIEDVIAQPSLLSKGYGIIHKDSRDPRGIDVALIYKTSKLYPLYTHWLTIKLEDTTQHTRDVLFCTAIVPGGDTITFAVAHLPSRRGSATEENQLKRIEAAIQIRAYIDSVCQSSPHTRFVIMGDMNDTPDDESMRLLCQPSGLDNKTGLFNLMQWMAFQKQYSITFKGEGYLFDQFICSLNCFNHAYQQHVYILPYPENMGIYKTNWITHIDKNGMAHPFYTHYSKHLKGYSDHWPVYLIFTLH